MSKLTAKQINHFEDRINSMLLEVTEEIKRDCTTEGIELSPEQMMSAIKGNRATLRDEHGAISYTTNHIRNFYVFSEEIERKFDKVKFEERMKPIRDKFNSLKDKVIFGTGTQAITLLKEFDDTIKEHTNEKD